MVDETDRLHERVAVLEAADRYTNSRVDKLESQIGTRLNEMRDAALATRAEMKSELSAVKDQVDSIAKILIDIREKQAGGTGATAIIKWALAVAASSSGWLAYLIRH